VARSQVRSRVFRILFAGITGLVLAAVFLENPAHSRGASAAATRTSSQVAVIPGFAPNPYPGTNGVPALPLSSPELAPYHFTQLAANKVTPAALSSYDTVFLYGIRWSDIPATGQAAINAFAATHKVVIWDADDTGAQTYSSFVHPFSTLAAGEKGQPGASVVTYPAGNDFLASDNKSSPYYLDPNQMVNDKHMINHMNAMKTGTTNWAPGLEAANHGIPNGGWVLAWTYGSIGNHTGLVVYSGIDADAMAENLSPNYAVKELALDFAAPFQQTPASCASSCKPPPGSGGGQTHAACSFVKKLPGHWVHGRVPVVIRTSIAAGITGQVLTSSGHVVARGREGKGDLVRLVLQTTKLPSNRRSRLRAVILVKGKLACTKRFGLKVDNVPPRLLSLATTRTNGAHLLELSVSESSSMSVVNRSGFVALHPLSGHAVFRRPVGISAHRTIRMRLSASVKTARLILRDRAGNTLVRRLVW
jgi:hypothetical protein